MDVGALISGIGCWGNTILKPYSGTPHNSIGNYLGPYIMPKGVLGTGVTVDMRFIRAW